MTHQLRYQALTFAAFALTCGCTNPDRNISNTGGSDASGGSNAGSRAQAGKGGRDDVGGSGSGGDSAGAESAGAGAGGEGGDPIDACIGVLCDAPPASKCNGADEFQTYDSLGSCVEGVCSYAERRIACRCEAARCTTDPCVSVTCNAPPAANCKTAEILTSYASTGDCDAGSCSYEASDETCEFGCAAGACKPDPCASTTCDSPPTTRCKDANTRTTYAASGSCDAGKCSYEATDTDCPGNQACSGQGVCALCKTDASCGTACAACSGATPKCKAQSTSSACVGCLSNADCSGATPVCNTTNNTCQARPSCVGLAKTCGPSGNQDCCGSGVVTGNTFNRGNDPAYPATVSTFRLDNYEVTVGRFRKFVAAYSQNMIAAGAGKNANNPSDPGWSTAYNASLPADAAALKASVAGGACMGPDNPTWTNTPGNAAAESLPVNCIPWFQAAAFCIWDGGRLPTEAEWNYAAAGGTAQRNYPWGGAAPDCSYAVFRIGPNSTKCVETPNGFARVGSRSPQGDGVWGQSDLAGNISEWVQDWYVEPYPGSCNDCANLTASTFRVVRGGYSASGASELLTSSRNNYTPNSQPFDYLGIRCARTP